MIPFIDNNEAAGCEARLDSFFRQVLRGLIENTCPVKCHVVRRRCLVRDLTTFVLACDSRDIPIVALGEERHHGGHIAALLRRVCEEVLHLVNCVQARLLRLGTKVCRQCLACRILRCNEGVCPLTNTNSNVPHNAFGEAQRR